MKLIDAKEILSGYKCEILNEINQEILFIRLNHRNITEPYSMYIENQFSIYFLTVYTIQAIHNLFLKNKITYVIKKELFQKIDDYFSKSNFGLEDHNESIIENKRNYIKKAILAILYSFKRNEYMGAKKRMKLLYLLKYEKIRNKAISIKIQENTRNHFDVSCIDFICGSYGEFLEFQQYIRGQYESMVKEYVLTILVDPGFIEPIGNLDSKPQLFRITELGQIEIQKLFKTDKEFCELVEICSQLAKYFDNLNNTEFEMFLKNKVDINWNKHGMGEFYGDYEE